MEDRKNADQTPRDAERRTDNLRYFRPHPQDERPALRRITLAELTHVAAIVARKTSE